LCLPLLPFFLPQSFPAIPLHYTATRGDGLEFPRNLATAEDNLSFPSYPSNDLTVVAIPLPFLRRK
jgi:hypothetical protein